MATSTEIVGSFRWISPELLQGEGLSISSDVWAYGMTALVINCRFDSRKTSNISFKEILTGYRPYHETRIEVDVLHLIMDAQMPLRPRDVSHIPDDNMWAICQRCWKKNPSDRPSMRAVARMVDAAWILCEDDLPR
jgi:serine/threonine protein kinase